MPKRPTEPWYITPIMCEEMYCHYDQQIQKHLPTADAETMQLLRNNQAHWMNLYQAAYAMEDLIKDNKLPLIPANTY